MGRRSRRRRIRRKGKEIRLTAALNRYRLGYSDILRIYGAVYPLSIPITLSRVSELLRYPTEIIGEAKALINAEDELYIAAALGFCMGIMRYEIGDKPAGSAPNMFYGGSGKFVSTRPARKRQDEVIRAVHWQQIAPPYSVYYADTYISEEENCDEWETLSDQVPNPKWTGPLKQSAPRVISRGINPPVFKKIGSRATQASPYIVASKNPNGSAAIAALGRVYFNGYYAAPADIEWNIGRRTGYIGVFGIFDRLTLVFDKEISGESVYCADLKDLKVYDITEDVVLDKNRVTLDGALLKKIGTLAAASGDLSEPGLVLRIGEESRFESFVMPVSQKKVPKGYYPSRFAARVASAAVTSFRMIKRKRRLKRPN